jgi:hypothetical protein
MIFNKAYQIIYNNLLSFWFNKTTTATFWYLPESAQVYDKESLSLYLQSKASPFYLIDYKEKLKYQLKDVTDDIIVLPYQAPIGEQLNPEAAFQYALGLHDKFLAENNDVFLKEFLRYADYFVKTQSPEGDWHYNFDWYISKAPWSSALAQSRGVSVMLRAWLITKNEQYLHSAKKALSKFKVNTSEGGYLHYFREADCYYFEEYPNAPSGVINGFMATIFAIWEMSIWADDNDAKELLSLAVTSLEKMLPFYTVKWWTIYDRKRKGWVLNINSPRYHAMQINYLACLATITNSAILFSFYEKWKEQVCFFNKTRAVIAKFIFKMLEY